MAKYAVTLAAIHLERSSSIPLYVQIYDSIRRAILSGQLSADTRLPSSRDLACSLEVSRNTVTSAFEQLFAEGYIERKVGAGTYVAQFDDATVQCVTPKLSKPNATSVGQLSRQGQQLLNLRDTIFRYRSDEIQAFRPGVPALDRFPTSLWSKLTAQHGRYAQSALLGYGDPCGYKPLRECIADYLCSSRAMRCEADQVIIVSGSQQALDITARVLLNPGDAVWIEDPGYIGARNVFLGMGANLVPVSVDEEGLNVEQGASSCPEARLAYVTPSHQFPLGCTMSLTRRMTLLQWVKQAGGWILEDDYDSEYRYRGQPLSALQGLDNDGRVIYMGTFSKVLFPSLRLGYLVVPPALVDAFAAARAICDRHSPLLEQAVLTEFMVAGHFNRHLRKMRALYAERQSALITALQEQLGHCIDVQPCETGMHVIGWLPKGIKGQRLSQNLLQHGITAPPLSTYYLKTPPKDGLVLGYAATDVSTIYHSVDQMVSIFRTTMADTLHYPNTRSLAAEMTSSISQVSNRSLGAETISSAS